MVEHCGIATAQNKGMNMKIRYTHTLLRLLRNHSTRHFSTLGQWLLCWALAAACALSLLQQSFGLSTRSVEPHPGKSISGSIPVGSIETQPDATCKSPA